MPGGSDYSGEVVRSLRRLVFNAYPPICHLCGGPGATTVDHIIPRSKGGQHTLENCRPAHVACNSIRKNMDIDEWFRLHPLKTSQPSREW